MQLAPSVIAVGLFVKIELELWHGSNRTKLIDFKIRITAREDIDGVTFGNR